MYATIFLSILHTDECLTIAHFTNFNFKVIMEMLSVPDGLNLAQQRRDFQWLPCCLLLVQLLHIEKYNSWMQRLYAACQNSCHLSLLELASNTSQLTHCE